MAVIWPTLSPPPLRSPTVSNKLVFFLPSSCDLHYRYGSFLRVRNGFVHALVLLFFFFLLKLTAYMLSGPPLEWVDEILKTPNEARAVYWRRRKSTYRCDRNIMKGVNEDHRRLNVNFLQKFRNAKVDWKVKVVGADLRGRPDGGKKRHCAYYFLSGTRISSVPEI